MCHRLPQVLVPGLFPPVRGRQQRVNARCSQCDRDGTRVPDVGAPQDRVAVSPRRATGFRRDLSARPAPAGLVLPVDSVTKLVLAGPVTATQTHRDAIASIEDARCQVHDLLGRSLLDDVTCTATGVITR